jgi:hypothetical protein
MQYFFIGVNEKLLGIKKQNRNVKYISFNRFVYLVLLALIIFTYHSISKYKTKISGTSIATIAMFVVDSDIDGNSIEIDCNETNKATRILKITNKDENGNISEVRTRYNVIINLKEKLPDEMLITLINNENNQIEYTISDDKLTYTFNNVGEFLPGIEDIQEAKLIFSVADASSIQKDFKLEEMSINVYAEQVD